MSNSSGSYYSTREHSFKAFDRLPPTARQALANAAFDWAPQPILTRWRDGRAGYKTGKEIANTVASWDAKHIAKDRKRVWGIDDAPAGRRKGKRR